MSVEAITWAVKYPAENATEKAILLVLANYADGAGASFPGQQSIASLASCGERTVRRVLASFEERGIIRREERRRRDGSRTSDVIVLVAFQQAANLAGSDQPTGQSDRTNRPTCPHQPATVAGLTTFDTSEDTPETRARAKSLPSDDDCTRFANAFPAGGMVNVAKASLPMVLARPSLKIGGIDRLICAASEYGRRVDEAKSKPRSLTNWLADWPLVEECAGASKPPGTDWRGEVQLFQRFGSWRPDGPCPDQPGCKAPADVLAEFGYQQEHAA
jgi:helix-turn-helix protein